MQSRILLMRATRLGGVLLAGQSGVVLASPGAGAAAVRARRALHVASWNLPVTPGGTLVARLPCVCRVVVRAQDPQGDPGAWDRASVTLRAEPPATLPPGETPQMDPVALRAAAEALALSVKAGDDEDDRLLRRDAAGAVRGLFSPTETSSSSSSSPEPLPGELRVEASPESTPTALARVIHQVREWLGGPFRPPRTQFDSDVIIDLCLPGKFNLDLELQDGSVSIHDTFEGDVRLVTGRANVDINRIKGMYIDLETGTGDLSAVVLQGHVSISATQGNIDIAKAQGPSVKIATRDGDVQARVLYAEYASVRSGSGNIRLGGAQGNTTVRTGEGNVEIAGVEGRLQIETDKGDVEAQLSVPTTVSVHSRTGDIAITVPPDLRAKVLLEAASNVDIDDVHLHAAGVKSFASTRSSSSANSLGESEAVTEVSEDDSNPRSVIARGWIGPAEKDSQRGPVDVSTGLIATHDGIMTDRPVTVVARAPTGDVSLRAGSWSEFAAPSLNRPYTPGLVAARFPRWAAAFPPPSEDEPRRATAP